MIECGQHIEGCCRSGSKWGSLKKLSVQLDIEWIFLFQLIYQTTTQYNWFKKKLHLFNPPDHFTDLYTYL